MISVMWYGRGDTMRRPFNWLCAKLHLCRKINQKQQQPLANMKVMHSECELKNKH